MTLITLFLLGDTKCLYYTALFFLRALRNTLDDTNFASFWHLFLHLLSWHSKSSHFYTDLFKAPALHFPSEQKNPGKARLLCMCVPYLATTMLEAKRPNFLGLSLSEQNCCKWKNGGFSSCFIGKVGKDFCVGLSPLQSKVRNDAKSEQLISCLFQPFWSLWTHWDLFRIFFLEKNNSLLYPKSWFSNAFDLPLKS